MRRHKKASEKFGRANYYAIVTINKSNGEVITMKVRENPDKKKPMHAGFNAAEFLVNEEKIDVLATPEIGEISFHTFYSQLIDVYKTDANTVNETLHKFQAEQLELLDSPTRQSTTREFEAENQQNEKETPRRHSRRGRG